MGRMWIMFALGAALLASFNPIIFPENPTAAAFGALLALALMLFPIMQWRAHRPVTEIRARLHGFVALGVIGGIAPLLGYAAFSLGLVGYVSALFKMSSVFALLWAYLFLREKDVPRRLPGAAIMMIGAILISA
jgi:uncharacterized membrane protein